MSEVPLGSRVLRAWQRNGAIAVVVLAAAGGGAWLGGGGSGTTSQPCATTARDYESRFAAAPGDWHGGDGVFSVALPGRRVLWLFGDSFVGTRIARNSALLQDAPGRLHLLGAPLVDLPAGRTGWLWPGAGWVHGRDLWTLWNQTVQTGSGVLDFRFQRTWIARSDAGTLRLRSLTPIADRSGIAWGAGVLPVGRDIYIYGVEHHPTVKHAHLARVSAADPRAPWRFYNGGHWAAHPLHRMHVAADVGSTVSVVPVDGSFALISQAAFGSHELRVATARSATGPWTRWRSLYRAPLPRTWTPYNAVAHPEAHGSGVLVSYSVSTGWTVPPSSAQALPRFVRVRRTCLARRP